MTKSDGHCAPSRRSIIKSAGALVAGVAAPSILSLRSAYAAYPDRPVKIIVANTPGGPSVTVTHGFTYASPETFDFNGRFLTGAKEQKPRWKQCAESADTYLGEPLGKEYVARYFPPEAKARVHEMVVNVLAAMGEVINGLDWMSPETKKRAQEKVASFDIEVGKFEPGFVPVNALLVMHVEVVQRHG